MATSLLSGVETRVLSLSAIYKFFIEDPNCIERGENSYVSKNVLSCSFDADTKTIKAVVAASMKKMKYNIMIYLRFDYSIEKASCSCPRGEFVCHHMASVALCAHYNLSRTDIPCPWTPKPPVNTNVYAIMPGKILPAPTPKTEDKDHIEEFRKKLKKIDHNMGLLWLMSPEADIKNENIIPYVEDVLLSEEYILSKSKRSFLENKLKLSPEIIQFVAEKTIGQSENSNWLIFRKHRITASNFGAVIKAYNINSFPVSLFKKLVGSYNLEGLRQIQYGRRYEKVAIAKFEEQFEKKIQATGLWLDKCGYLGASPDGLIGEDGIVEVKCPYSCQNKILKDVLTSKDIIYFIAGSWHVNKSHSYYHQIQGQLYITNRKFCKLIMYSCSSGIEVLNIKKDENWAQNLILLKRFYFEHYLKYLSQN